MLLPEDGGGYELHKPQNQFHQESEFDCCKHQFMIGLTLLIIENPKPILFLIVLSTNDHFACDGREG